jgi:hypothetical protein
MYCQITVTVMLVTAISGGVGVMDLTSIFNKHFIPIALFTAQGEM